MKICRADCGPRDPYLGGIDIFAARLKHIIGSFTLEM